MYYKVVPAHPYCHLNMAKYFLYGIFFFPILMAIWILIPVPHFLTSSQGHSEDWLQVKSPTRPLASAPAAIPASCRLSRPPGKCCYDCDCEMLQVHGALWWNKEKKHGYLLLNVEGATLKKLAFLKTKDMGVKGAAENQDMCALCLNKNRCHKLNTYL